MNIVVTIALALFVVAMGLSSAHSWRVATALAIVVAVNVPIEVANVSIEASHPLRFVAPAVVALVAYSEMVAEGPTSWCVSRAWAMAACVFALAGVSVVADLMYALGGAWIVPGFSIAVCLAVSTLAVLPKGRARWLLS